MSYTILYYTILYIIIITICLSIPYIHTGLVVQAIGGSILASAKTQAQFDLGSYITLIGLAIQVGFFTIFCLLTLKAAFGKGFRLYDQKELKLPFQILLVTAILIYIRNLFRLIEYAVPHGSYIPTHEALYFAFESAPILTACFVYGIWSFGWTLPEGSLPDPDALPQ